MKTQDEFKSLTRGPSFTLINQWNILVKGNYCVNYQNDQNLMLLTSSDTKRTLICLQIPPKENWFQYIRRVYATAINLHYTLGKIWSISFIAWLGLIDLLKWKISMIRLGFSYLLGFFWFNLRWIRFYRQKIYLLTRTTYIVSLFRCSYVWS